VLETALPAQRLYAYTNRSARERAVRANAIDVVARDRLAETAIGVGDTGEAVPESASVPPAHRRRLGRSYFIPPALWTGPGPRARERTRRDGRRW
jgi:hypothetical protein